MPHPEIALALPAARGPALAAVARRAEERGFGTLVAVAHRDHDPLVAAAFAAAATRRARLATAGLPLPGRSAAALARAARTLDELSAGRFALGVAAARDGVPASLTRGDGRPFDAQLAELRRGPAAAVELLLGGADRATIDRVARAADGWIAPLGATAQDVAGGTAAIAERWTWHGRAGAPRVLALLDAREAAGRRERVAGLRDAGAATVVLVGAAETPAEVDALADALALVEPVEVAR